MKLAEKKWRWIGGAAACALAAALLCGCGTREPVNAEAGTEESASGGETQTETGTEEGAPGGETLAGTGTEESAPGGEAPTETGTEESAPGGETPVETAAPAPAEPRIPEAVEPYVSPYQDFFDTYPECVAWLYIEGTVIDYPVMWREGDNEHYLLYDYEDKPDKKGSLMMDEESRISPMSTNVMIHGHNTRDVTMFGMLDDYYATEEAGMEHKDMWLYTRDGEYRFELMSAFYTQIFDEFDTVFKYYFFYQAESAEEFDNYIENVKALELYDTGVDAEFGDTLLSLSTCAYHVENGRFVVIGIYKGDQ